MGSLLLIEDDEHIGTLVKKNFELEGFDVLWFQDGSEALDKIFNLSFDVVVLDIMLPKVDGLTILKKIKKEKPLIPVILLSSKDTFEDRIIGLELDADDYLGKPFNFKELLLRVKNLLRNKNKNTNDIEFKFGGWLFCEKKLQALKGEFVLTLSAQEYELIKYLFVNKNQFVSRGELLENVWKIDPKTKTRSVDIFISRLRKYFELDPSRPELIISKRLRGYMLKV
tara:strand:+ start:8334 stop:9011 length:678 start_codon:yes stop_codon:yes gene_type:complete